MDTTKFLRNLEGIIDAKPGTLSMQTEMESVGTWDSLTILGFMAFVDRDFNGFKVQVEDLVKCKTPADLASLLGNQVQAS